MTRADIPDRTEQFVEPPARRKKRSDLLAEHIRDRIVAAGLKPGDRIPGEWMQEAEARASKGTMREAFKALETQGLITTRTGPGGGTFVTALSSDQAMRLLSNLFLFHQPTIAQIYALRKLIEPELAASLAGRLDAADYAELQATIRLYENEPETAEEEFRQRIAELDFNSVLASCAGNQLMGFICVFLHSLLRDMTVCRRIYAKPNPKLRETALNHQVRLLRALKRGDVEAARAIMHDHMLEAERYMLANADIRASAQLSGHQAAGAT